MIDFEKMLEEEVQEKPTNPLEIFQRLNRADKYYYLRGPQQHVLEAWHEQRTQKDTIIKMNTGSGKTLVGLIMLQSCLNDGLGPAIYLCLDNQLVEQVIKVANECGIQNVASVSRGLPAEFLNSEAILITTFAKLVNGKSKFGVKGTYKDEIQIGSLLVDDAHSCLNRARESFTISLERTKFPNPYDRLFKLFKPALHEQAPGKLKDLEDKIPYTLMSVPYWNWLESIEDVTKILSECRDEEWLEFQWNLLQDSLANCSFFISNDKIEITPQCIPIEYIPSFHNAKRRFFTSATLVDDSHLIKDFGASCEAVSAPLKPTISGDMGERMIIIPSLVDRYLDRNNIIQLVLKKKDEGYNVVVLTPSDKMAKRWEGCDVEIARRDTIVPILKNLESTAGNCVVVANRYDGIDLPDSSCRILIMDGKPLGESLFEKFTNKSRPGSRLLRAALAQKIEQGLGRGVRSGSDYCVVILIDDLLINFLALHDNQNLLSPQTKVQIEMGMEFGKKLLEEEENAGDAVLGLMDQCLTRESSWIKYHRTKIQSAEDHSVELLPIKLANAEKEAFKHAQARQYREASNIIQKILYDEMVLNIDKEDQGWYLQLAASYLYRSDQVNAMQTQLKAHSMNTFLARPPEGVEYKIIQDKRGQQPNNILEWVNQHTEPNALVVDTDLILNKLDFGVPFNTFEEAFANLATIIGFKSQRPEKEYGRGPDVLWRLSDGVYLIIAAKNEATTNKKEISKKYADQLSGSSKWFDEEYVGQKGIFVIIHPYNKLAYDAYCMEDTVVLDKDRLQKFTSNIRDFIIALSSKSPDSWNVEEITKLVTQYSLDSKSIVDKYLTKRVRKNR